MCDGKSYLCEYFYNNKAWKTISVDDSALMNYYLTVYFYSYLTAYFDSYFTFFPIPISLFISIPISLFVSIPI